MNESAPRKRGRPRKSTGDTYAPIASGALAFYDRLVALDKKGDLEDILHAYMAWLADLRNRAYQDGPTGDDFMVYLETVWQVRFDNDPSVSPMEACCQLLALRALSPRREARAYAKFLLNTLDQWRANGHPPLDTVECLRDALTQNAKGKGRGTDPDILWRPARDQALFLAYQSGIPAEALCTLDGRPDDPPGHSLRAALLTYVPDLGNRPIGEGDTLSTPQAVFKAIAPNRRAREITRQCLDELRLLAFYLPQLTPPGA